jgi:hypothetical protein
MPPAVEQKVRKRGGAVRVRTVRVAPGKYAHVYVVRRKGPRGGRTVLGQVKRSH